MQTITVDGREYVIPSQLAAAHGLTVHAIRLAIHRGNIPAVQLVGRWLIPVQEAAAWQPTPRGGARQGAGRRKKEAAL